MEQIHPIDISWKKKNKNEKIINRILWIIIIILFIIIIFEVVFQFIIVPQLKIKEIIVDTDLSLSREEILHLAGIKKNDYYFSLDTVEIGKKLKSYPAVRDAKAIKKFPNTVTLVARKRVPLAIALIEDNGRSLPALIDDCGVVFYIGRLTNIFDLPVISGLDFKRYETGMKLPDVLINFLGQLNVVKEKARTLFNFISEIRVVPIGERDYELLFYMIPYTTKIRFGESINENILAYAMMVLDVLHQQGMAESVKEIDFRSREIVYKHQGGGEI